MDSKALQSKNWIPTTNTKNLHSFKIRNNFIAESRKLLHYIQINQNHFRYFFTSISIKYPSIGTKVSILLFLWKFSDKVREFNGFSIWIIFFCKIVVDSFLPVSFKTTGVSVPKHRFYFFYQSFARNSGLFFKSII